MFHYYSRKIRSFNLNIFGCILFCLFVFVAEATACKLDSAVDGNAELIRREQNIETTLYLASIASFLLGCIPVILYRLSFKTVLFTLLAIILYLGIHSASVNINVRDGDCGRAEFQTAYTYLFLIVCLFIAILQPLLQIWMKKLKSVLV